MSQLLTLVVNRQTDIALPFLKLTKGEVVKSLGAAALHQVATSSISCAHFPVRIEKHGTWKSCGLCPACVFRRVAMYASGIPEGGEVFQHDFLDASVNQLSAKKLRYLTAYLIQVDSLSELDEGKLPFLIARELQRCEVFQSDLESRSFAELFRRYRSEWNDLLHHARKNGCNWAHRINLPGQSA